MWRRSPKPCASDRIRAAAACGALVNLAIIGVVPWEAVQPQVPPILSARIVRRDAMVSEYYARLDARSISLDGFTETGAGLSALTWDAVEQDSVSANLGAAWRWVIAGRRFGTLRPSVRLEWSHEFEDIGDQGVRYADWAASPTYLVPLDAWSRDNLRIELGNDWMVNDRLSFGVGYRGGFGDASSTHGGELRVKYGW